MHNVHEAAEKDNREPLKTLQLQGYFNPVVHATTDTTHQKNSMQSNSHSPDHQMEQRKPYFQCINSFNNQLSFAIYNEIDTLISH
jgi:hypothetical protein